MGVGEGVVHRDLVAEPGGPGARAGIARVQVAGPRDGLTPGGECVVKACVWALRACLLDHVSVDGDCDGLLQRYICRHGDLALEDG